MRCRRFFSRFVVSMFAILVASVGGVGCAAEEESASAPTDDEPRCEDAHSEADCMAIKGCGWDGEQSKTPNTCFAADIGIQPGTGDPGGGGSRFRTRALSTNVRIMALAKALRER